MTELYINQNLNQLAELDYDQMPENPLDWQGDEIKYFIDYSIETKNVVNDLVDNLFDGDDDAYQNEHDKYTNATDLFEGLNKIAKEQGELIYPITEYQRSKVRYYLGSDEGWDCGVNGFVLVDVKQAEKNLGFTSEDDIVANINNTLEDFTNYANGDVFLVTFYQLNDKGEKGEELDCAGSIQSKDANIEGLFNLGFLEGNLKDWKEARENIQASYTVVD